LNISKNTLKAFAKLEFEAIETLIEDNVTPDAASGLGTEVQAGTSINVTINTAVSK